MLWISPPEARKAAIWLSMDSLVATAASALRLAGAVFAAGLTAGLTAGLVDMWYPLGGKNNHNTLFVSTLLGCFFQSRFVYAKTALRTPGKLSAGGHLRRGHDHAPVLRQSLRGPTESRYQKSDRDQPADGWHPLRPGITLP